MLLERPPEEQLDQQATFLALPEAGPAARTPLAAPALPVGPELPVDPELPLAGVRLVDPEPSVGLACLVVAPLDLRERPQQAVHLRAEAAAVPDAVERTLSKRRERNRQ